MSGLADAEYTLRRALRTQLLAVSPVPRTQIAFVKGFTRPQGLPWLRERFRLGRSEPANTGAPHISRFESVYFVDLFVPAGTAEDKVSALRGALLAGFAPESVIGYAGIVVHVTECTGEAESAEADWVMYPLTIGWWADVPH